MKELHPHLETLSSIIIADSEYRFNQQHSKDIQEKSTQLAVPFVGDHPKKQLQNFTQEELKALIFEIHHTLAPFCNPDLRQKIVVCETPMIENNLGVLAQVNNVLCLIIRRLRLQQLKNLSIEAVNILYKDDPEQRHAYTEQINAANSPKTLQEYSKKHFMLLHNDLKSWYQFIITDSGFYPFYKLPDDMFKKVHHAYAEYGLGLIACSPSKLPENMDRFCEALLKKLQAYDQTEASLNLLTASCFDDLIQVHPFADGNGRTARMLCNLIRMNFNHPPLPKRSYNIMVACVPSAYQTDEPHQFLADILSGHFGGNNTLEASANETLLAKSAKQDEYGRMVPSILNKYGVNDIELALRRASAKNDVQSVYILVSLGVTPNAPGGKSGRTALHWATLYKSKDVISLLTQHGANELALDSQKKTPGDYL